MADWFAAASGKTAPVDVVAENLWSMNSRRSPVLCRNGCVASSQPLASSIGLDVLRNHPGANAADAAIAVAAALCVTEPCSTGIGGDMFCLYYDASTKSVTAINGSGRSPKNLTHDVLREAYPDVNDANKIDSQAFCTSPHSVTVPGAVRGYEDLLAKHGSGTLTMAQLLQPAIDLATEGFPVAPITANSWNSGMGTISRWHEEAESIPLSVDGKRAPRAGEILRNPDVAGVLTDIGRDGATNGFYRGRAGKAIVATLQKHGGVMTEEDLADHDSSTFPDPISALYRGKRLWQVPPNGQGIAGLIALSGLERLEKDGLCEPLSPDTVGSPDGWYHVLIEMMRLGFADARAHVCDPDVSELPLERLMDQQRIGDRAAKLFQKDRAVIAGQPVSSSCTVSFQVVDKQGNAISFVNSNFMGFGTGIVPEGCGFTLQNRGFGFTLNDPSHPNALEPSKRPYHTIIPGMITHDEGKEKDHGDLYATISNMGGNMQPQGHMQLTVSMLAGGLDPQSAIDLPRFCLGEGTQTCKVVLEPGIDESRLSAMGHSTSVVTGPARSIMGKAQIIRRDRETGVLWAGSDGRADGCAMGY